MRKPTVEEIADYCRERGNGIDAEYFFDHYESKGWLVGKCPMKNWQAAVRTWEKNKNKYGAPKSQSRNNYGQESIQQRARRANLQARPGETWEEFDRRVKAAERG